MQLRPYQQDIKNQILTAWRDVKNVLAVMPTGAGKTVTFSDILHDTQGYSCAVAHRQELVSQISLALARDEVPHNIIGPNSVVKNCVNLQMFELGRSFHHPNAECSVAGVDTLISRQSSLEGWGKKIQRWVMDEAHHLLDDNKWGKAVQMFPNAYGLGVTATPTRADRKGLGAHAEGVFHKMVVGPSMRELINMGFLTDYRIFAPPSDFHRPESVGSTGDFTQKAMSTAVRNSHIIGDVVQSYLRIAPGKRGITFVPDVETAVRLAEEFTNAGVPAQAVSAKTPDSERAAAIRKLKNGELLQLVNVDLFGEGFDLPAIEVVSFARPTESYGLYVQQFGRALRLLDGKLVALIIDHVGNVVRHGLPDAPREWSLDSRIGKKKSEDDAIPVKACPECMSVYERVYKRCPFCGYESLPMARSAPEFVDGDLEEIDPLILAEMRGEVAKLDMDKEAYRLELFQKRVPQIGQMALVKKHVEKQAAQTHLREKIALWAGYQRYFGRPDSESYRRFYFAFGVDVLSAQALGTGQAYELAAKIDQNLLKGAS